MKRPGTSTANQQVYDAAVSRLAQRGYGYDARLSEGVEVLGFGKLLDDDVHAIVQFQARGEAWTINLLRVKSPELHAHVYGGYAGAVGARLGHVVWFVANVQASGQPDRWWTPAEMSSAVDLLLDYGLPWLENPHAPKPWEMPALRWSEFVDDVLAVVGSELATQGYRVASQTLNGHFPYPYFVKSLPTGEFALIEFQPCYSLDPAYFMFDVRLQRKATDNPLDFGGVYGQWRAVSLGQLVWRQQHPADEAWSLAAAKAMLWQYADRAELADRLREVLNHVPALVRPWLEDDRAAGTI